MNSAEPRTNYRFERFSFPDESFTISAAILTASFYSTSLQCPIVDIELYEFKSLY